MYPLILCLSLGFAAAYADPEPGYSQGAGRARNCGPWARDPGWMHEVSDAQRAQLELINADFRKKQAPLQAELRALKLALTAMALADAPDIVALDKKIYEWLDLKRRVLHNKVDKISAVRAVLNEAQRARYDLHIMKKAAHGGKRRAGHGRAEEGEDCGRGGEVAPGQPGYHHGMGERFQPPHGTGELRERSVR